MANTTFSNPGAFQPYKFRSFKAMLSSAWGKLRTAEYAMALRFLISELMNRIQKRAILNDSGKNYCPLCEKHNGSFVHLSNRMRFNFNYACPHCSSRPRHRGLFSFYKEMIEKSTREVSILHFAPEPVFYALFRREGMVYKTTDFFLEDVDYPGEDIQRLTLPDHSFDVVLCNHVLEHVPDDIQAIKEIFRILKPGGKALITVPGDFKRKTTIFFDNLNYNGHYRDYGSDFESRLKTAFNQTQIVDLHQYDSENNMGIPEFEWLFIGIKD